MDDRLKKLKELEAFLYNAMQDADARSVAAIAKQYRETIKEIEDIEGTGSPDDEISRVLAEVEADGQPRSVRKNRSEVLHQRRDEGRKDSKGRGADS